MKEIEELIREGIKETVRGFGGKTVYRAPLIGFASADNPGFGKLSAVAGRGHLRPQDLLPGARSVVAFFLPFSEELVLRHKKHPFISREWAEAYIETNRLIAAICQHLCEELRRAGVDAAWQQPTHNFDPVSLASRWSHKHVAYLCGLGTFGLHTMLITDSGCAGRLGSLVVSAELQETPSPQMEYCLYRRGLVCNYCIRACPVGALEKDGLDKQECYRCLLRADGYYNDLGLSDVCGKCATGPCALSVPP
ncbi:4Fe-4S ferredoxin [Thermacetogenium phaeum DSM 12270]|jgi:epoxyqueuosine reductase QueG|uniref:4Fe-4S ferredoxin n=2 Tax=Thermacetogenium phaeum TaxID=85874 RepID=K4LSZ9_THEPS|nr:epoxyqueuosine reductase [Thermacetogenium phaeum]AFV11184.1 4Fe-4S ferredoxin [Thermacetogenium phaeum DSM 12270]KUK36997.1 MAG: 4Fe-4S ferredoxin [Thermacetogenium phaeum]MDN5375604.1 epoxyqueuosine reductase [Thermacetogenium sp.]